MFERQHFNGAAILEKLEEVLTLTDTKDVHGLFNYEEVNELVNGPYVRWAVGRAGIKPLFVSITVKYVIGGIYTFLGEETAKKIMAFEDRVSLYISLLECHRLLREIGICVKRDNLQIDVQSSLLYLLVGKYTSNLFPNKLTDGLDSVIRQLELPVGYAGVIFTDVSRKLSQVTCVVH